MSDYILSCCSTVDMSKEHLEQRNIPYVKFNFMLDGKDYADDLGQTISYTDFYKAMEEGKDTKTTQVNVSQYIDYFTPFLENGKDIIHITLSSGLSGTYNCACQAAEMLKETYPERKIYVIDSLGASSGSGMIVDSLADMRDSGKSIDELYNWIMENRLKLNYWFFSTDLKYFVRGGRISKTAGVVGGILGICPLLNVDAAGKLVPVAKIRSKKKVIVEIVNRMEENAIGGLSYDGKCYISHSACMEDAQAVADLIKERFTNVKDVVIYDIGTTIGSHTGPGTVALFFYGKERA